MRNVYEYLQTISNLDWTFFAPAMMIQPGERTGQFRTSAQGHLFDANGESKISSPDYAIAMVDELEKPQHLRQLFTVGY